MGLYIIWLVVSTPSEKKLGNWDDYSQYMGNRTCSKPPTSSIHGVLFVLITSYNWYFNFRAVTVGSSGKSLGKP